MNNGCVEERVRRLIEREQLMSPDQLYLVAVSGGADSVALLLILQHLGYRLHAVHCNFHLRGEESDRDETFVSSLCQERQIPLHLAHFDTSSYAQLHHVSIEMAARELRYHYFEQLRQDLQADGVCVAHHRDDHVETLLMNLIRGTGLRGMVSMKYRNEHIIRPLLDITREEIEDYLKQKKQSYVTDSTNLCDDVLRNKIRLHLVPLLQQLNPAASDNIAKTIHHLSAAEKLLEETVRERLSRLVKGSEMDIEALLAEPSPELLLFEWLKGAGFSSAVVEQVMGALKGPTGKLFASATHELLIDRGRLVMEPIQPALLPLRIPEPGTYFCSDGRKLSVRIEQHGIISRDPLCATLDADTVQFPLTLRPVREGDRFVPLGMTGEKLVSDFLTDRKRTLFEKRRQLVVEDARHEILWLVGERPAHPFRVQESTRQTLVLELIP